MIFESVYFVLYELIIITVHNVLCQFTLKGPELMLDHTDMQILEELSKNSRITMKELGEKVHLTGQALLRELPN